MTLRILPMSNVVSFYARESRGNGKKGGWLADWNGLIDRAPQLSFSPRISWRRRRGIISLIFTAFLIAFQWPDAGERAKRPNGP